MYPSKCDCKEAVISTCRLCLIYEHWANPGFRKVLGTEKTYFLTENRIFVWILRRRPTLQRWYQSDCLGDI